MHKELPQKRSFLTRFQKLMGIIGDATGCRPANLGVSRERRHRRKHSRRIVNPTIACTCTAVRRARIRAG
jgi:hypothetical protein